MTVVIKTLALFLLNALLGAQLAYCEGAQKEENLGKIGKTYPIIEKDILEEIMKDLNSPKKKSLIAKFNQERLETAKSYARTPRGVHLPRASRNRRLVYDPSITLAEDIRDATGKVIFKKGTTKNPFDFVNYNVKLCFIDGNDLAQVEWVKSNCDRKFEHKIILTSGNPIDLSKQLDWRVYFDQGATLIQKFGIQALPAAVTRGERVLNVEEVKI